jgi:hypothetical protein
MTDAWRNSWAAIAAEKATSPINAYLAAALERWNAFTAPQTNTLGQGGALTAFYTTPPTATGGKGILTVTWDFSNRRDVFGIAVHAQLGGAFTNARENLVALIPTPGVLPSSHIIRDLAAGSYTVRFFSYQTNGTKSAQISSVAKVVT